MEGPFKTVPTYTVRLYIGGDLAHAKQLIRQECWLGGLCVTVEPTTFIYTGGEEAGVCIGFVNYPRFPSEPDELFQRASKIAQRLIQQLNQKTALLVATDKTIWIQIAPPGARG